MDARLSTFAACICPIVLDDISDVPDHGPLELLEIFVDIVKGVDFDHGDLRSRRLAVLPSNRARQLL